MDGARGLGATLRIYTAIYTQHQVSALPSTQKSDGQDLRWFQIRFSPTGDVLDGPCRAVGDSVSARIVPCMLCILKVTTTV